MPRLRTALPRGTVQLTGRQVVETARGLLSTGPEAEGAVRGFERRFAAFAGARRAVATSSGKAALVCILRALGAREGDGVVLACYNVPEVISVLGGLGLEPRLADIDPATFDVDPERAEAAVDARTRFLLATHLYGNPAALGPLRDLCARRGLILIEDCAQAIGARYQGRPAGTFGRAALFSFGLMKSLNTLKGGMVITDDDELAAKVEAQVAGAPGEGRASLLGSLVLACAIRAATRPLPFTVGVYPALLALQELDPRWIYRLMKMRPAALESGRLPPEAVLGRMEAAQARCGAAGLDDLAAQADRRTRSAERLREALAGVPGVRPQATTEGGASVWSQFVVRAAGRDAIQRALLAEGIDSTMGYLQACHRLPGTGLERASFPHSEALERDNLYLPVSAETSEGDVDRIAAGVRRAVGAAA
jgi:perosamine synthetase